MFYICFSLSSHFQSWLLISSLSLLTSNQSIPQQLNRERTKWHSDWIRGEADHLYGWGHSDRIVAIVITVGGASGMGKATPIIHIIIVVVIAIVIAAPISSISISLFWWLVVLIVDGWLILVDGGRLIGLWVWDLGWYWCLSLGWSGWLILVDRVLIVVFVWVFFFFL